MSLTKLLGGLFFILGGSTAIESDATCKNGDDCVDDTPNQDLSVFVQIKNVQVLTARNGVPNITAAETEVFVRPAMQKLAEMNATMTTLKALSVATPEVNIIVNGMINTIKTDIKPHIVTSHTDTQALVDTTISTLSSRTIGAVEKKKAAVAADKALSYCYAEQRRLLVLHETCTDDEATLKGEKETLCSSPLLETKTYSVPSDLKKDLTCDFSTGTCTAVRDARKNEHATWLNGLSIVADKISYDNAHAACVAATELWTNKIARCQTMWSSFQNKHAQCLYALKAQQLAICMFGDNLQSKCETKSSYDTLILDILSADNSHSTSDRASEWRAVSKLECMLGEFVGGANFDNAMIATCTKNDVDAGLDFEKHVGIIDKKTAEYTSLITEANFNCAETAIMFTGDKWSVPTGDPDPTTHMSSVYTKETGWEYAFDSDSTNPPFAFCASKSAHTACGDAFNCGAEARKPAGTKCFVGKGCTAAACCVKMAVCGDHVVDANEDCDDGNTVAGDGCSCTCTIETSAMVSVQSAWNNHFKAFGEQNVNNILKDYNDDSVISVYNQADGKLEVFKGLDGVTRLFTSLFISLSDTSDLTAQAAVHEASGSEPGSVFLTWSAAASGYADATDTFVFDLNGKITTQNVVVTYVDPNPVSSAVHDAWQNHFEAFGAKDVAKILEDYTEDSTVTLFDIVANQEHIVKGLDGVEQVFKDLFKKLSDTSDLKAPVQVVTDGSPGEVFLIWSCAASGYKSATDTFIFDEFGKIQRQNVVFHFEAPSPADVQEGMFSVEGVQLNPMVPVSPTSLLVEGVAASVVVQTAWDNHFAAFGEQNVVKILQDYNDDSVVRVYNHADGKLEVFKGLGGIERLFTSLFKSLFNTADLAARVAVHEASGSEPGSVLLTWSCAASGYAEATDTFVFDVNGKITSQNVVVTYVDSNPVSSPVHDAWQNHFEAFGAQDVGKILKDYTEDSTITLFDIVANEEHSFKGLRDVATVFKDLFHTLSDTSDLRAPVQVVKGATDCVPGEVFLIWSCAASGYKSATDTFIFDKAGKIQRQNVVFHFEKP